MGEGDSSSIPGRALPFPIGHVDFHFSRESFLPLDSSLIGSQHGESLEATNMPEAARRWTEQGREWVESRRDEEITEQWRARMVWDIGRTPDLLSRVGTVEIPFPSQVTVEHIRALRHGLGWQPRTMASYFSALRPFLRWVGAPVAESRAVWSLPSGEATHRRWLEPQDLADLYNASQGAERVLIVLEGYNGLRRIEARRMRVRDIDLSGRRLRVHGKGRNGGKWRTIPMTATTQAVLTDWIQDRAQDDYILQGLTRKTAKMPLSENACDSLIRRAAKRAGLPMKVSGHDLRRTFGRVAYRAGMDLIDLKGFYGHKSTDMTAHYVGVTEDSQRHGLEQFETAMAAYARPPQSV